MSALKQGVYRALSLLSRALLRPPRPGLRVLMYHAVGARLEADPYGNSISRELFAEHVRLLGELRGRWPAVGLGPGTDESGVCVTFDDGYRETLTQAAPLLAERRIPFVLFATADFIRAGGPTYLGSAELRELARAPGAAIGSHGRSHRPLTSLAGRDLDEELSSSRRLLEDMLGQPVDCLAYPHGAVDRRVRDAAARAGYRLAGTSRYGFNRPGRDPLLLCRTEVTGWDSPDDLRLKLEGHWDWYAARHSDPQRA